MWLRHKQQNRTSPRVRQRHRGDRIRWSPDSYSGCSFTEYIPKASDGYLLPQLGTYSENWDFLETGYIKAGVNGTSGDHQGALGNYGNAAAGDVVLVDTLPEATTYVTSWHSILLLMVTLSFSGLNRSYIRSPK